MDELKDVFGIEMASIEKKMLVISILADVWEETDHVLEIASNRAQRVEALKKQEAIKYLLSLIKQ